MSLVIQFHIAMYVIKFQKCGLPHVHILLILAPEDKVRDSAIVNNIISAVIPDLELGRGL